MISAAYTGLLEIYSTFIVSGNVNLNGSVLNNKLKIDFFFESCDEVFFLNSHFVSLVIKVRKLIKTG